MGKHRHKKSFYDVDEEELQSSPKHRHHHHRRRRRHRSAERRDDETQDASSPVPFQSSHIDEDEATMHLPPATKRQRVASTSLPSPSRMLSQLIENPEFLANAGAQAREFAETAKQLLAKPDLDSTTQQIIYAMAQAAFNVGKRLSSSSSTPVDQCVEEISISNSTTYSSSALLSPTLSTTSSSSASTTPQQPFNGNAPREEIKPSIEPESDGDILIKQLIERAMKLTQQGDTRHAQHLLGVIHEKLSNKRKRAAAAAAAASAPVAMVHVNDPEHVQTSPAPTDTSHSSVFHPYGDPQQSGQVSPSESEQSSVSQCAPCFSYPPPPPLPPLPPLPGTYATKPAVQVPRIDQVKELLSNPSEVQDILKKLFGANENPRAVPPEELQSQSHMTAHGHTSLNSTSIYSPPLRHSNNPSVRMPPVASGPQPYNSSLAFIQGNRRHQPPLQTSDRCFSSSTLKTSKLSQNHHPPQPPLRSYSFSSSNGSGMMPPLSNPPPSSAPSLMDVNPTFPFANTGSAPLEPARWSNNHEQQYFNHPVPFDPSLSLANEQQRAFHPFWCATCALGSPHQVAYQEHLRSHILCTVPGCSYTASEPVVRAHHQTMHENNPRHRMANGIPRSMLHPQHSLEPPWPLMRM